MAPKPAKPSPADHAGEYCHDERGRPRGGLWLDLSDTAKTFGVTVGAVHAWRRDASWLPRFEGLHGGRVFLNVVQVFFWRCERAVAAGRGVDSVPFELPDGYQERGLYV